MKSSLRLTRTLVLTASLALVGLGGLHAQTPPTPPPAGGPPQGEKRGDRLEKHLEFLTEKLSLNPAQQAQVKNILISEAPAAKALRENTTLTPEAKKAQWRELMEKTHSEIGAILTPEQQQIFNDLPNHPHHPGTQPEGQPGEQQ